ncbi:MAG TPA: hypothetical protein VFT49_03295 [Candidatus Saccharimonadales bacterium]|nr:hypothetical protein [Candidatus Saccharimonadales bacterium]
MAEEENNWVYHSSESGTSTKKKSQPVSWEASEYIDHKQGPLWFLALSVGTAIIAAGIYIWTKDYFATGAIIAVGVIAGVFAHQTPRKLSYGLSGNTLTIGDKEYHLSEFKSFSIIEEGAISSVELTPLKRFMPPLSAFFETKDQDKIIDALADYLPYEDKELDGVERLSRRLRF